MTAKKSRRHRTLLSSHPSSHPSPVIPHTPSSPTPRHPRERKDPTITADHAWVPACAGMTAKKRDGSVPILHPVPRPVMPQHPVILANARTQPSPPITLGPRLRGDDGKKKRAAPHSLFISSFIPSPARHPPNTPSSSRTRGPNHHRRPRLGPRLHGDDGKKSHSRARAKRDSRPSPEAHDNPASRIRRPPRRTARPDTKVEPRSATRLPALSPPSAAAPAYCPATPAAAPAH